IGRGGGLVDKDKPRRIKQTLLSNPASARTGYVSSMLLGSVQAFFFKADIVTKEEAPNGAATAGDTRCILDRNHFIQCQIRLCCNQAQKPFRIFFQSRHATAAWLRRSASSLTPETH